MMLVEMCRDMLPAHEWRYPNNWNVPWAHRPTDRMLPFNYRNADGLNDDIIGKNYIYEISPAQFRSHKSPDVYPTFLCFPTVQCDHTFFSRTIHCSTHRRTLGLHCIIGLIIITFNGNVSELSIFAGCCVFLYTVRQPPVRRKCCQP